MKVARRRLRSIVMVVATTGVAHAQSGYQAIEGTRVFTEVDQAAGVATFSNDCGRQRLTQRQLQAGAIPRDIIPCPRPAPAARIRDPSAQPDLAPGSYAQTCARCTTDGGRLSCACRRIDQTYRSTSIDPGRCRGGEVENLDGVLSCARGPAERAEPAPRNAPPPSAAPLAPAPPRRSWGALASGMYRFQGTNYVSVGSALNHRSEDAARDAAITACLKGGDVVHCDIVGTFSTGCGYITTGKNGGQVGWGSGRTAQAAYDACTGRGIACKAPIGGCLD